MTIFVILLAICFVIRILCYKNKRQILLDIVFLILFMGGYANMIENETTVFILAVVTGLAARLIVTMRAKGQKKPAATQTQSAPTRNQQPPVRTQSPAAQTPNPVRQTTARPATQTTTRPATQTPRSAAQTPNPTAQGKKVTDYLHNCVQCRRPLSQPKCSACGYNHEENTFFTLCPLYFE